MKIAGTQIGIEKTQPAPSCVCRMSKEAISANADASIYVDILLCDGYLLPVKFTCCLFCRCIYYLGITRPPPSHSEWDFLEHSSKENNQAEKTRI